MKVKEVSNRVRHRFTKTRATCRKDDHGKKKKKVGYWWATGLHRDWCPSSVLTQLVTLTDLRFQFQLDVKKSRYSWRLRVHVTMMGTNVSWQWKIVVNRWDFGRVRSIDQNEAIWLSQLYHLPSVGQAPRSARSCCAVTNLRSTWSTVTTRYFFFLSFFLPSFWFLQNVFSISPSWTMVTNSVPLLFQLCSSLLGEV